MIKSHKLDAKSTKPVERAAKYLANNTQFLHYDRALADGLPIATGVIERACRYLVVFVSLCISLSSTWKPQRTIVSRIATRTTAARAAA
jgi:hypothetical protein